MNAGGGVYSATMTAWMRRGSPARSLGERRAVFALHAATVLALAWWVRSLAGSAGIGSIAACEVAAVLAWRRRSRAAAMALALIGVAAAALLAWHATARQSAARGTNADTVARAHEHALAAAIGDADRALKAAADSAAAGRPVAAVLPQLLSDAGVIVYAGTRPTAWAGRSVVPTTQVWERSGAVETPLYLVQYATSVRGDVRAVATNVVRASPPADHLVRDLAGVVGSARGATFGVALAGREATDGGTLVELGGAFIRVTAHAPSVGARLDAIDQSARSRGAALLLVATIIALAALWRPGTHLPERVIAAALPIAALAITPLNTLSNVTRLFDPSTYYVAEGGPFTSSVGALAVTSALALFAVMAAARGRRRPRRRWAAAIAVVVIAGLGPFLLRDLARGVNLPPGGASTELWLAWELSLFLTAASLVAAGVAAGQWALGPGRGLPLWIAPALAAVAAALGPPLLESAAQWPGWYPVLWVAAIAALALARRSRVAIFPSAFVAACGAAVLIWGATLREGVEAAERDVRGMTAVDSSALNLLDRFASDVARAPVARRADELLARYASSDVAALEYPAALGAWPADGPPTLLSLGGDERFEDMLSIVAFARESGVPEVRSLAPAPAAALAIAVPSATGDVTSLVLGARTRLALAPPLNALFGFAGPTRVAPYQLALAGQGTPGIPDGQWTRRATHFHAEWALAPTPGRSARVRADVGFASYDMVLARGMLVVLVDLFVVVVLLVLDLLADGVLQRWARTRVVRWRGSYRLRLTLALYAFFVGPALIFGAWSYRRLQVDDRSARELLVGEALRLARLAPEASAATRPVAPAVASADAAPQIAGVPGDALLFVYRHGQLIAASDSLLVALAPVGRWLSPDVQRALGTSEDLIATAMAHIGGRDILFGYRTLGPDIVLAVPEHRDDAALEQRRDDLGILVTLATVLGALAALGLSGVAARQLARPIGTLRAAALAVAGGSRAPIKDAEAPAEFAPVFTAFDRMARELAASEAQLSRAERVFAWGEMARQVAHEIKNPLTPIRLGVQHMLRAWRDRRPDFGTILEDNASRVLREIDHLDATARSFSRYGSGAPAEIDTVDVSAVARDIAALEALGADGLAWRTRGAEVPCWAHARADELREVLLNLC